MSMFIFIEHCISNKSYNNSFIYLLYSVDCSTDKPKQFRWNFHKKSKNSATTPSHNANNTKNNIEPNSITEEGISRLNELIDFLSKQESKFVIYLASCIFQII